MSLLTRKVFHIQGLVSTALLMSGEHGAISRRRSPKKDWHFVLLGPVVKTNEDDLPRQDNIHYLGMKNYQELPQYLAGWDAAIMPLR